MSIVELINLAKSKLATLNTMHSTAVLTGNINEIQRLDITIIETQETIDKLNSIPEE